MKLMIKPPNPFGSFPGLERSVLLFLAGTIDMGNSFDWQEDVFKSLGHRGAYTGKDTIVLNPRRDDWDNTVEQKITDPTFYQQVTWEQDGLSTADVVVFNFLPESKSVVTMLELGQTIERNFWRDYKEQKIIVCCPDGFWRQGNVHKICEDHDVPMFTDYERFKEEIKLSL